MATISTLLESSKAVLAAVRERGRCAPGYPLQISWQSFLARSTLGTCPGIMEDQSWCPSDHCADDQLGLRDPYILGHAHSNRDIEPYPRKNASAGDHARDQPATPLWRRDRAGDSGTNDRDRKPSFKGQDIPCGHKARRD